MQLDLTLWQSRFGEYLQLRNFSPRTIQGYTTELRPLFDYLRECGVESLGAVGRDLVEGYRTHLFYAKTRRGQGLSLQTQCSRLQAVKAFFKFLARKQFVLVDAGALVELPRLPQRLPRVILTEAEVWALLGVPDILNPMGLRDRAALELLYGCGIRSTELCELELDALDFERKQVHVRLGKGQKDRMLPLGVEAEGWLRAYLHRGRPFLLARADEPRVFLSKSGGDLTRSDLAKVVRKTARAAGLQKQVSPHTLRHSCATHMLRHGAGLRHLQALLGHSSLNTTQRYTQLEITDLRRVLKRCHPRERNRS